MRFLAHVYELPFEGTQTLLVFGLKVEVSLQRIHNSYRKVGTLYVMLEFLSNYKISGTKSSCVQSVF